MFTSSSPCRKDQFAVSYFSTTLIVLIQVYNWEIQHHSLVCCCGLADILCISNLKPSFVRFLFVNLFVCFYPTDKHLFTERMMPKQNPFNPQTKNESGKVYRLVENQLAASLIYFKWTACWQVKIQPVQGCHNLADIGACQ